MIRAIDGPVLLADCFHESRECEQMSLCTVKEPLRKVHEGILKLLYGIIIFDLSRLTAGCRDHRVQAAAGPWCR